MRPNKDQAVRGSVHDYFQWVLDSLLSTPLEHLETLQLWFRAILPLAAVDHLRGLCARIDAVLGTPRFSGLWKFHLVLYATADEAARFKEEIAACFPDASARGVFELYVRDNT